MEDRSTPKATSRYCVLEYRTGNGQSPPGDDTRVIALATSSDKNEVEIRVHPEWEKIVKSSDRDYFRSLWRDLKVRIESDPEAVFQQLSFLSVGPLITHVTGSNLSDHPDLFRLLGSFRSLRTELPPPTPQL